MPGKIIVFRPGFPRRVVPSSVLKSFDAEDFLIKKCFSLLAVLMIYGGNCLIHDSRFE
jgi:hypothetical protein